MLALLVVLALATGPPIRPDPRLTPGDVATSDVRAVCVPGYAGRVRLVSEKTKRAIYAEYRIQPSGKFIIARSGARVWDSDWEVDHLVSLQLGGSNEPANLWVESKHTKTYNALVKDSLEQFSHREICAGRLNLADIQRRIAADWIALYRDLLPSKVTP